MQQGRASGLPADEPVPTVISLFRRGARLMIDDLLERLAAAGFPDISPSEHLIFESLPPGGARVTELSSTIGMTHQAAGELVAALEARGYLHRRADPTDRRARIVVLTSRGRGLVRTALQQIGEIEQSWAGYLARAGLSGELLPALRSAVRQVEAERPPDHNVGPTT